MKRAVRRMVLEYAAKAVEDVEESDGLWDELRGLLGREDVSEEAAAIGDMLKAEAGRLLKRAARMRK